jgi:hypothetical protein
MEKVNLPCQVIETLEKRWARKLQQQVNASVERTPGLLSSDDHGGRGSPPLQRADREEAAGRKHGGGSKSGCGSLIWSASWKR